MKKETRLNIRIDPELKDQLKRAAKADDRTLANFVILLLKKEFERKGTNG